MRSVADRLARGVCAHAELQPDHRQQPRYLANRQALRHPTLDPADLRRRDPCRTTDRRLTQPVRFSSPSELSTHLGHDRTSPGGTKIDCSLLRSHRDMLNHVALRALTPELAASLAARLRAWTRAPVVVTGLVSHSAADAAAPVNSPRIAGLRQMHTYNMRARWHRPNTSGLCTSCTTLTTRAKSARERARYAQIRQAKGLCGRRMSACMHLPQVQALERCHHAPPPQPASTRLSPPGTAPQPASTRLSPPPRASARPAPPRLSPDPSSPTRDSP